MNVHEYQAKELLKSFHIPVPFGVCIGENTSSAIATVLRAFENHSKVVVKAQIHAGGRGKGHFKESGTSGVRLVETECAAEVVAAMFGKTLVTNQTGAEGKVVHKVYVTETVAVAREFYLSLLIDRDRQCPVLMASDSGGCDVETVAKETPEKVLTFPVDPLLGLQPFQARRVACLFQLSGGAFNECIELLLNLYRAFVASDACLIEINPLVLTQDGHLSALDCKMQLDDNARFRQNNFASFDDPNEVNPTESEAKAVGIHNYVALDGDIACLANGAGLGMATLDLLDALGGKAANFLDIGDTASAEQIETALCILLKHPKTRGVFVNIFGGTLPCDRVVQGLISVTETVALRVPCVMRLMGNRKNEGLALLQRSGLPIFATGDLTQAAETIVRKTKAVL
ncbi:MAG: ADP-forming succinate--CoA ligase subunit beta [Opitutales bacterium]|nr:ADP-forming succinate--CoA ligase subunit beta [Opitutales bacterium]